MSHNFSQLEENGKLKMLIAGLRGSWCKDTTSPTCSETWPEKNPALGQCAVTALVVQDLVGGELMRAVVGEYGSHYYNRLPSGQEVDLTREQFPVGTFIPPGKPADRQTVLTSDRAVAARTKERYELLKRRFDNRTRFL